MTPNSMNSTKRELETENGGSVTVDEHLGQTKQQRKRKKKKSKNSQAQAEPDNAENVFEPRIDFHLKASESNDISAEDTAAGTTSKSRARKLRRQRQKQRHAKTEETTTLQAISSSEEDVSLNVPPPTDQTIPLESMVASVSTTTVENTSHATPSNENQTMIAQVNAEVPSAESPDLKTATRNDEDMEVMPQVPSSDDTNGPASVGPHIVTPDVRGNGDSESLPAGRPASKPISPPDDTDIFIAPCLNGDGMVASKPVSPTKTADRLVSAYADDEKTTDNKDCSCTACIVM